MQKVLVILGVMVFAVSTAVAAGPQGSRVGSAGTVVRTPTSVKPAGSQRKDGTFATTGTTANGGTTRPTTGQGVKDGSGVNK